MKEEANENGVLTHLGVVTKVDGTYTFVAVSHRTLKGLLFAVSVEKGLIIRSFAAEIGRFN